METSEKLQLIQIVLLLLLISISSFNIGYKLNVKSTQKELEKQIYINTQLELEYNDLRNAYDYLEFNCKK